jgi:hypothetical protein
VDKVLETTEEIFNRLNLDQWVDFTFTSVFVWLFCQSLKVRRACVLGVRWRIGGQDRALNKSIHFTPNGNGFCPYLNLTRRSAWATMNFSMWDKKGSFDRWSLFFVLADLEQWSSSPIFLTLHDNHIMVIFTDFLKFLTLHDSHKDIHLQLGEIGTCMEHARKDPSLWNREIQCRI